MKYAILFISILFILPTSNFAQKWNPTASGLQEVFDGNLRDFEVSSIPEQWRDEDVVILAQWYSFDYERARLGGLSAREAARVRVMVKNPAALPALYVPEAGKLGIKIIRSTGEELRPSLKESEVVENAPLYAQSYAFQTPTRRIPLDLQANDIIEYFYILEEKPKENTAYHFQPVTFFVFQPYPVVAQTLQFRLSPGFYINQNHYNGEFPLKYKQNDSKDAQYFHHFKRRSELLPAEEVELWYFPHRSSPHVKVQAAFYYQEDIARESFNFVGDMDKPKGEVTQKEIVRGIHAAFAGADPYYYANLSSYLKADYKELANKDSIVELCYHYFRYFAYVDRNEPATDFEFVSTMIALLNDYNVKAEIVAFVPRDLGTLDRVLFRSELKLGISVAYKGQKRILSNPSKHANLGDTPPMMQDVDVISFKPNLNKKIKNIPFSTFYEDPAAYDESGEFHQYDIQFSEDFSSATITHHAVIKGHNRPKYWNLVMKESDYLFDEKLKYEKSRKMKGRAVEKLLEEKAIAQKQDSALRIKELAKWYQEDFGLQVDSLQSFKMLQTGRYPSEMELEYQDRFVVKNLAQDEDGLRVLVGKLMGEQINPQKVSQSRRHDIYLPHAQLIETEIRLQLPEAYSLSNLSDFDLNVGNAAGGFFCNTDLQEDQLSIQTTRMFRLPYITSDQWDSMYQIIEAAYQTSQKALSLK